MTADYRAQALQDPTTVVQELYRTRATTENFPRLVAAHFSRLFETPASFKKIPTLNVHSPPQSHRDRALVRFRAMVQDTSLSTEMYLSNHHDGSCGGWGMYEAEAGSSSSASEVDYANLQECNVLWATSVPAESHWCADELDQLEPDQERSTNAASSVPPIAQRTYKFPHSDRGHIGLQVKVYDRSEAETLKSTDVVTFVGIISTEPCGLDHTQETTSEVPTLHVLFTKPHTPTLLPRPFPRLGRPTEEVDHQATSGETAKPVAQDTADTRRELINWIAEEALAGDLQAAEWVLFSCIARVQSRHPPLLPPSLVVSRFPAPPPVPSITGSSLTPVPTLSAVLASLLPLTHTLNLSLENLNKASYTPESKDEDLHAGVLQLPQGTVLLVSEGGVREGQLQERGMMNVRALQEVMDAQTLAYVFPFSQFSFPTDISCIILAEGRKSTFFRTELDIPLRTPTDPAAIAALYKPADQIKMPSREKLAAFRDLVVGARCGKVQVPEATSEYIQAQFVRERQGNRSVTADDLIRWMTVSKLYALSLHEATLSVETWQRAKALDDLRRTLLA
ncbi:mini-chromosome maintenance replisome factor-domain-containing protein [Cerioporus squamosus]|nr:mini-chromosome maintenance replisome factor-domain-containing protein [Cerioporus squamosus]